MKGYDSFAETPPRKTVMKSLPETPYSVLDLSPIRRGGSAAESFRNSPKITPSTSEPSVL